MRIYEWDIETHAMSADGRCEDVEDHNEQRNLKSIKYFDPVTDDNDKRKRITALVLTMDVCDRDGDVGDRCWAYVDQTANPWCLPDTFDNGFKIPERYIKEFLRHRDRLMGLFIRDM